MKKVFSGILWLLFLIPLFICAVRYRADVSGGVNFGISYSMGVLIPSLFPMIFLSSLLSYSPAAPLLSKTLGPVTRVLFGLPGQAALPIFLGLICGYPVGAKLTAGLLQRGELTERQGERLMLFVMNPGIPFSVLFVGGVIWKNMSLGLLFFAATSGASLLFGILLNLFSRLREAEPSAAASKGERFLRATDLAARSALSATANMCLYVVVFSAFLPLLHSLGISQWIVGSTHLGDGRSAAALLSFFTDVVHGVNDGAALRANPYIFVLGLSFGGLCIHFQLFSFFKASCVSLVKFYAARLVCCGLSLGVFALLASAFPLPPPTSVEVFSSLSTYTPAPHKGTLTGSICLLLLACAFIYLRTGVEKKREL